jgi:hypothetical protein
MQHLFLDNKYTAIYYTIVERARSRHHWAHTESHHIVPASFFKQHTRTGQCPGWLDGEPDAESNLVDLTIREHRLCHILLTRMTTGLALHKMARAAKFMMDTKAKISGLSKGRTYEKIKEIALEANSQRHKGKQRSAEEIEKQRQSRIRTGANNFSPEHRAKIAAAAKHKIKSPEEIAKFKETMKERAHKRSAEATEQMLATRAAKGPEYAEAVKAKWRASKERNRLLKLQQQSDTPL